MPLNTNTFDFVIPSLDTTVDFTPRLQTVQFGGGYKQVEADGINNVQGVWTVQYKDVPRATWLLMDQFLRAMANGNTFFWLAPPPYDTALRNVRVTQKWVPTWDQAGLNCSAVVTLEDV